MNRELDLSYLENALGDGICEKVDKYREKHGEKTRERDLNTMRILLLCLSVALNSGNVGLHDILRRITADTGDRFKVSVPAFCKARLRFSPQGI